MVLGGFRSFHVLVLTTLSSGECSSKTLDTSNNYIN